MRMEEREYDERGKECMRRKGNMMEGEGMEDKRKGEKRKSWECKR